MDIMSNLIVGTTDIDSYDHVNYSNYLRYYQRGHERLLEMCLSVNNQYLEETRGLRVVVRHSEVDFIRELFAGDLIAVYTKIEKLGNTSMSERQHIERAGSIVSQAKLVHVFTDLNRRPTAIPDDIREKFSSYFDL